MKEWFSAKELIALPGMPKTESAIIRAAKRDNWRSQPRTGRGGGREYHITSLPAETRANLAKKAQETQPNNPADSYQSGRIDGLKGKLSEELKAATETRQMESAGAGIMALVGKSADRDGAKHQVLAALKTYLSTHGGLKSHAVAEFVVAYNRGEITVDPAARQIVGTLTPSTLGRWQAAIKKGRHLGGAYGHRKGTGKIDSQEELRKYIVGFVTDKPHTSAANLYTALCARFAARADLALPSQRRVEDWVRRYREHQAEVHTAVANPDAWRNTYMSAAGSHAVATLNDKWEIDSTPADLELVDGRHVLIGIIDVHSRRPKLLVSKTSKATAVSLAIRRAIVDWGVPRVIKGDNGQEYVSKHQARVAQFLGVELHFSNKFAAWEKPHIERFFHTFSHGIIELLPGFIGHNVADRQALRARQSFAERLFKKNEVIELKLTAAELQAFCDQWVANLYSHETHGGLGGKTPFQVAAECRAPLRTISDERILDMLLAEAPREWCAVGKRGITINRGHYNAPELAQYHGQRVKALYDPADQGRVFVYGYDRPEDPLNPNAVEPGLHFVCIAECPERLGLSRDEAQARAKEIKQAHHGHVSAARKALRKNAKAQGIDQAAAEIMAHATETAGAKLLAFPKAKIEHASDGISAARDAIDAAAALEPRVPTAEEWAAMAAANQATPKQLRRVFDSAFSRALYLAEVVMGHEHEEMTGEDWDFIRNLRSLNPSAYHSAADFLSAAYEERWDEYAAFRQAVGWPEARRPKG